MFIKWRRLLLVLCGISVEGIYHLNSKQIIFAPRGISNDALFGYSIAYQPTTKRLIIGAPNSDLMGKIYDCNIENKRCVEFNNSIPKDYNFGKMWLGATVASHRDFNMACAPRYIEHQKKIGTFGKCFAAPANSHALNILSDVTDEKKGDMEPYELNMDSFGWSVDVTQNGSVIVGGPFMYTGRAIKYSNINAVPELLPKLSQQKTQNWYRFNFGYSVTSGHFMSKNKNDIIYAISSPYGMFGGGALLMSKGDKTWGLVIPSIHKPGVGAIFGAAMASANLLKNKPQALLVGAPGYANNGMGEVDRGAVYIYQYDEKKKYIVPQKAILGRIDRGRFGSAIVSLGDLNGDGLHEVAIAAPYEDSGAVYIYSAVDLLSSAEDCAVLQKIKPSGFKAFGLSIAALQDYDDNGCNELAIGAPENNKVTVYSCMAKVVVRVLPLEPHITSKYSRPRRNDTYYVYKSCVDIEYPKKPKNVYAVIEVNLRISHPTAKLDNSADNVTYKIFIQNKNIARDCKEVGIILSTLVGYEPMVQYTIKAKQLNSPVTQRTFNASNVLLSDLSKLEEINFQWVADCGDSGCKPNFVFKIQTTIPENYTIGFTASENVSVLATNMGDVAYSAYIRIRIIGVHVLQFPRSCEHLPQQQLSEPDTLKCQPRIPIKTNTDWQLEEIELDMKSLKSNSKKITFEVVLYPKSDERDPRNKEVPQEIRKNLTVNLQPDSKPLTVLGWTNIGTNNTVKISSVELAESGKSMSHFYTVQNTGVTDWVNIQCEITMPKTPFVKENVPEIESSSRAPCTPLDTNEGKYICTVEELKKNQNFLVMLPIFILPGTLDEKKLQTDAANVKITSQLKLLYGDHQTSSRLATWLKLKSADVPIWIILLAVLVGILVIGVMIFALYECGFFRRKNKRKLNALRRSVHRQSVRRSQMQRNSGERRSRQEAARETNDAPIVSEDETLIVEEVETTEKIGEPLMNNKVHPEKTLPGENEECKIKQKDQIIRGLQKNLDIQKSKQLLPPPPKEYDFL